MALLTDSERKLLDRLAAEGKATPLLDEELATAKALEGDGFAYPSSRPRGDAFWLARPPPKKPDKKPLGFLE
jgi:hypothetical protein